MATMPLYHKLASFQNTANYLFQTLPLHNKKSLNDKKLCLYMILQYYYGNGNLGIKFCEGFMHNTNSEGKKLSPW